MEYNSDDPDLNHCYCNTKYSKNEFYIKCDECLKWYHGKCVAITSFRSHHIGLYVCPDCQDLSYFVYEKLDKYHQEFLEVVFKHVKVFKKGLKYYIFDLIF